MAQLFSSLSLSTENPPTPPPLLTPREKLPKSHDCRIETLDAPVELTEISTVLASTENVGAQPSRYAAYLSTRLIYRCVVVVVLRCCGVTEETRVGLSLPFSRRRHTRISESLLKRSPYWTGAGNCVLDSLYAMPYPTSVSSHYLEPEESKRQARSTFQNARWAPPSVVVAELGQ